jgi:hypothetical protein
METTYRPVITSAAPLYPQRLEWAPQGWRECVAKIAEGVAVVDGDEAVCVLCGGVLKAGIGHAVDCLTMRARRMLDAEAVLQARQASSMHGVDIDAVHARVPAVLSRRTGTEG